MSDGPETNDTNQARPLGDLGGIGYWALLREDLSVYKEGLLAQGFWALRIHRFGRAANEMRFKPLSILMKVLHRIASKLSQIFLGIYIGANARIGRRCIIEHFGNIIIHSEVVMGDDVRLRQGVTIGNKGADDPLGAPTVGNGVDIGAGAIILGRIRLGDQATVGANAVVIKDVPAGAIAVGVPAVIKPGKAQRAGEAP